MEGIPPARATDNEDVAWALETAESLWKRNARVDAIVWLRRAAQEAAEAGDADRASSLMVEAAALTEAIGRTSASMRASQPVTSPPPPSAEHYGYAGGVDDLLATVSSKGASLAEGDIPSSSAAGVDELLLDAAVTVAPDAPDLLDDAEVLDDSDLISLAPPTPVPNGEPSSDVPSLAGLVASLDAPREPVAPPTGASNAPSATTNSRREERAPLPPALIAAGVTRMGEGAISALDLAEVQALGGTSELQRETLVHSADVLVCPAGVALPEFALAVVLEGEVTGTAGADGPLIARRSQGAISCRGTLDVAPLAHFTVSADDTTLALWDEAALAWALRAGAAAAEELRLDGDRWLAWSVIMRSALASKLPEDVRLRMVERLTPRALMRGAELLAEGQPVAGLLLVGYGTVVLDLPASPTYLAGDFVFADAALSAGRANATARAGGEGALVLTADRRTTQELYATEPLLLELLSASF